MNNPDSAKRFIANHNTGDGYKKNLCIAYNHYVNFKGIFWEKQRYYPLERIPKIPSEEKLSMLISASPFKLAARLSISKETGLRPIEVMNLRVKDIDLDKGLIYPSTAKHGSARVLRISTGTLNMIRLVIQRDKLDPNDKLFKGNSDRYGKLFRIVRNRLAEKLGDPSFKSIRLYDLRHFYATMLYHKTRDILFVKQQLGHKKIETTLVYTQLIDANSDEYHVRTATTLEEATQLLESGFNYVTEINGVKLFRKRK